MMTSDDPKPAPIKPSLTREEVAKLLSEGDELRREVERRLAPMKQVTCEAGLGQMVTALESMGVALESLRGQVAKLEAKVAKLERENR